MTEETGLRALSLGAGVQSTTLLLMSLRGEVTPFDVAVFADTGAEPAEVYEHLEKLKAECARHDLPLVTVSAGSTITERMLDPNRRDGIQIPAFIVRDGEKAGILRRQCTERFKSRPVYKWLNAWREKRPVTMALGISWDEAGRMRDPQRKWITNEYPLIDRRMDRSACHRWLAGAGWTAPRSACTFCPYHGDDEWRRLRDQHPADWDEAVRIDAGMRAVHLERIAAGNTSLTGTPFVHRSLVPLSEVDLRTPEDHGQDRLFGTDCDTWCGL